MKEGDFIYKQDIHGKEAQIGDDIRIQAEQHPVEHKLWWSEDLLCVMIGPMSWQRTRESGYFQPATPGKKYLDFEIIKKFNHECHCRSYHERTKKHVPQCPLYQNQ